jgi:hypothetical protein
MRCFTDQGIMADVCEFQFVERARRLVCEGVPDFVLDPEPVKKLRERRSAISEYSFTEVDSFEPAGWVLNPVRVFGPVAIEIG